MKKDFENKKQEVDQLDVEFYKKSVKAEKLEKKYNKKGILKSLKNLWGKKKKH